MCIVRYKIINSLGIFQKADMSLRAFCEINHSLVLWSLLKNCRLCRLCFKPTYHFKPVIKKEKKKLRHTPIKHTQFGINVSSTQD